MGKIYTALGLMSGTSLDGVDVSIIESDGNKEFTSIFDKYFNMTTNSLKKYSKLGIKSQIQMIWEYIMRN